MRYLHNFMPVIIIKMQQDPIIVKGKTTNAETRCVHFHSALDIIAIKMKCCNTYYPCIQCHEEEAGHPAKVWPKEAFNSKAVLCGNCMHELTIDEYLGSNNCCPNCRAAFNPGCKNHYHFYFET